MHTVVVDSQRDFQKISLTRETTSLKTFGFQRNANKIKLQLIVKLVPMLKNISRNHVSYFFLNHVD